MQKSATVTNTTTDTPTATVKVFVPFAEGEIGDLATLQATRQVTVNGTPLATRWSTRGAPFRSYDAAGAVVAESIRYAYADVRFQLAAGSATPAAPTDLLDVVAADNTATGPPSFEAFASGLQALVAYTDKNTVLGDTPVSEDALAIARAGGPGSAYTETTEGGTLRIAFEAWVGPGRHHAALRVLGHNETGDGDSPPNPPVLVQGLLQVKGKIELRSGDTEASVEIMFRNGASYPYPSAPPDGGDRRPGVPNQPTLLHPNRTDNPYMPLSWEGPLPIPAGEELERPLVRDFEDFTLTIDHPTISVDWRPWYIDDHNLGAGPYGLIPTAGNTTDLAQLTSLADGQGWGLRGSVSSLDLASAVAHARDPYRFIGLPTLPTLRSMEQRKAFTSLNVAGDKAVIRGPKYPLLDVDPSRTDAWYARGSNLDYLGSLHQSSIWHSRPDFSPNHETTPSGANQGGLHFVLGWNHDGEATLAGSVRHLYELGAHALRHFGARGANYPHELYEASDLLQDGSGRANYFFLMSGSNHHFTSGNQLGRRQTGDRGNGIRALWNGASATSANSDPRGRWEIFAGTHWMSDNLWWHALLTDSAMSRDLLRCYGGASLLALPSHSYPFSQNPRNQTTRAEARTFDIAWNHWSLEDDGALRDRISDHIAQRARGWSNQASGTRWQRIGGANDQRDTNAAPCGIKPNSAATNLIAEQYLFWQASFAAWAAMRWAFDVRLQSDSDAIANAVQAICKNAVQAGSVIDPTRLSAAAQRPNDSCFASRAAQIELTIGAGAPGNPVEGYLAGKSVRTDRTQSSLLDVIFGNIMRDSGRTNAGENAQLLPSLVLARMFRSIRDEPGALERINFAQSALETIESNYATGEEYVSQLGFLQADIDDSGSTQQPGPTAALSLSSSQVDPGDPVTLDASASTFSGPSSGVTVAFWQHYDEQLPGQPDATYAWDTQQTHAFNAPAIQGTYFPAVLITQGDGRQAFRRDPTGLNVGPGAPGDPAPDAALTIAPTVATTGQTITLDASTSSFGGPSSGVTLDFWASYDPASPGPPDATYAWDTQQIHSFAAGTTAGTFFPAVLLTQNDGRTSLFQHPTGYEVNVNGPAALFDVDQRILTLGASTTLDASSSTFGGPSSGVTLEFWEHYDTASPGPPDAIYPWDTQQTHLFTYPGSGTFFPALRITQADGRSAFARDQIGVEVQIVPLADPPESDFAPIDATALVIPGSTIALRYTGTGVLATSWIYSWRGAAGDWVPFSTERNPLLVTPTGEASIDVRCEATNAFGTDEEDKLAFVTFSSATLPTAAFNLAEHLFETDTENWPLNFVVVTENTSEEATSYLWVLLETGDQFEATIPPPFQIPGPGHFTLRLYALNSAGLDYVDAPIDVLAGDELRGELDRHGRALAGELDEHGPLLEGELQNDEIQVST